MFFQNRLVVFKNLYLRQLIFKEVYDFFFIIYFGSIKMYQDLRQRFWWIRMEREIVEFVVNCGVCRRVKAEYQRSAGIF